MLTIFFRHAHACCQASKVLPEYSWSFEAVNSHFFGAETAAGSVQSSGALKIPPTQK